MEGRELRRSYTQMEFPVGRKSDKQHQIRTSKRFAMPSSNRMKFPTLEIYRPPGQRIDNDSSSKLNVHAKEFVSLQTSRSAHNMASNNGDGSSLRRPHHNHLNSNRGPAVGFPLHHSKSSHLPQQKHTSSQPQNQTHTKVQWVTDSVGEVGDKNNNRVGSKTELKRSKSMSSAHSTSSTSSSSSHGGVSSTLVNASLKSADLPIIAPDVLWHNDLLYLINASKKDPNEYSCAEIIDLARQLVEKATEERQYAEQLALCCASIIEKESRCTFLESLLNSCQYVLQKKNSRDTNGSKYYAFMAFLSHLYTLMKRQSLEDKSSNIGIHPNTALLCLLVQCCQGSLKEPVLKLRQEIECLFFVVTTIGRELEQELPKQLEALMSAVRDAFFNAETSDAIRKTLMQLIELHAARWQLPAYTVMYYQSASSVLP